MHKVLEVVIPLFRDHNIGRTEIKFLLSIFRKPSGIFLS